METAVSKKAVLDEVGVSTDNLQVLSNNDDSE